MRRITFCSNYLPAGQSRADNSSSGGTGPNTNVCHQALINRSIPSQMNHIWPIFFHTTSPGSTSCSLRIRCVDFKCLTLFSAPLDKDKKTLRSLLLGSRIVKASFNVLYNSSISGSKPVPKFITWHARLIAVIRRSKSRGSCLLPAIHQHYWRETRWPLVIHPSLALQGSC